MNDDKFTTEYKRKWEQVALSDSSRLRMEGSLLEYARFHAVTENVSPVKSPFTWLSMKPVQAALALVLVVGVGTTLYLRDSSDVVAPLATTEVPTTPEVAPTPTSETETPSSPNTLAIETGADTFYTTPAAGDTASDVDMMNVRSAAMKESADVASDEMFTTMLSQGAMDIDDYRADAVKREKIYRALMTKYDTEIADDVRVELIAKLNTILALTTDSEGKEEVEARLLLDKATTLVGEIESTLSLLGAATVKDGIITDVDFGAEVSTSE